MASSSAEPGARPKALMGALHDWDSPLALGSHHLARGLVNAGWDVAYVSNGISPPQVFKDRHELRRRLKHHRPRGRWHLERRLWSHVPLAIATPHNAPLLRSRFVHRHWQQLTVPNVVRMARAAGFGSVDLVYLDTPVQSFWLDAIDHGSSVVRIMDRSSGFQGVADEFLVMEREAVRAADLVVFAATSLEDELRSMGARRLLHLPNGVDFDHFAHADGPAPPEYDDIAAPRAVYVGDIAKWFDFDTLNEVADRMPDVSFVLVGPDRLARTSIVSRPNVHVLGPRPYADLPRYVANAEVGLIPFDVRRFPEAVNAVHPLKLYEYMACGLPVVATRWQELEVLASPALLCDDAAGFVSAIRAALAGEGDRDASQAFARQADWAGRVSMLLETVEGIEGDAT